MIKFKLVIIACISILFYQSCFAQFTAYVSIEDDKYGCAVGTDNTNGKRDKEAEQACIRNGGKNCTWFFTGADGNGGVRTQYTWGGYALLRGYDKQGKPHYQMKVQQSDKAWAINSARSDLLIGTGVIESTIEILCSGYEAEPKIQAPPKQAIPAAQWSAWINEDCFKKISYRYMGKELVNLNYQYHYYFQAKNDYAETVYFIMSLKDADGKERFGTRHTIRPGQTIEFVEKMDKNYIRSFAVEKVCFKIDNGKYVACDDENSQNKPDTKSSIEEDARKVAEIFCTGFRLNKAETKKEFENFKKETEPFMNSIDKKYYKGRMESEFLMGNKEFEYFEKLVDKEMGRFCK